MSDFSTYRQEFPITERCAFLSHASVSPLSNRVVDAVNGYFSQTQTEPATRMFPKMMGLANELRQRAATLINAPSIDDIAIVPNTGTGINIAALSLPLEPGDNVLVLDGDYPANVYPWFNLAHRGVLTKIVPQRNGGLDLNLLEQRIDRRTRVIALSTVMFATGFRNDIAAVGKLCKERGIYFVVDAIQSLGVIPMDVQACNIDILVAGSQKWLLSMPGCAVFYCRQELLDELVPGAYVGAASVVDFTNFLDYNFTLPPNADRFNVGTPNFPGMVALNASIGLLQEVGIERVEQQVGRLIDASINDLTERGYELAASTDPAHRSGIVVALHPNATALCKDLDAAAVIVTPRGGGVRVAPHFYNTVEEVLQVGAALEERTASS